MQWSATWTQAIIDFGMIDMLFDDVTLRARLAASIGGDELRLELDNRFGAAPLEIGHLAVNVGGRSVDATVAGSTSVTIAPGDSVVTDAVALPVAHGDEILVDLYLPKPTKYGSSNAYGAPFRISAPGDHAGSADFVGSDELQIPTPDGTMISLSGPFLRGVDVAGAPVESVIVCFGDSITVAGWPQLAAALLPANPATAVVNRGIAGNRLRFDPAPVMAMFGDSGLARFDRDVLATPGVSHVVLALGTNDLGHPGSMAALEELPTADELIAANEELIERAKGAGVMAILATIPPFLPAPGYDAEREVTRTRVNAWMLGSGHPVVDFDAALRSAADGSQLAAECDSGDHLHPNADGQQRMARAMAEVVPGI